MAKLFPIVIIVLCVAASLVYFWQGNLRQGLYWLCCAALFATVTF